jgi:DNA relaxase NicK
LYTSTVVRESQPDWLTLGGHTERSVRGLTDLARTVKQQELADGNAERPWRLLGYEGFRCGRVRFGLARGWALVQLSGDTAAAYLTTAVDLADSVSRLDLAVTIQTDQPDPTLGERAYVEACAFRVDHPRASEPWRIAGYEGGHTTYIGRRGSDLFFRLYNKEAEARSANDEADVSQYANSWRYELELKGKTAQDTAERLVRADNVSNACLSLVRTYVQAHGITATWDDDSAIRPIGTFRRRSDRDRKLDWLRKQVEPTVRWLIQHGDSIAAMNALGLTMNED